ncbi:hypothetical protein DCAR_0100508 [Daucus carota subsp. sativus]|uniref:Uncharacterized protein n=1 Tax=Daucus carota subsp. sativus TaxID=79200 RepID=A0A161ZQT4_DAUCS|nr:hypothetical protein DCAR_0100508 [Daucus carota subsp. sativus]
MQFHRQNSFPKMRGAKVVKPKDAMNTTTLNADYVKPEFISQTPPYPQDAVIEIKYSTCKNHDLNSQAPKFRVHNLCAGRLEQPNKVIHIIDPCLNFASREELNTMMLHAAQLAGASRTCTQRRRCAKAVRWRVAHRYATPAVRGYARVECGAAGIIDDDLKYTALDERDLKVIWYGDGKRNVKEFWAKRFLKHGSFSTSLNIDGEVMVDYASKIYEFGETVVTGNAEEYSLGEFLEEKGFDVGKYHQVEDLHLVLKEYFEVDVYPTFVAQGTHPFLHEIGVLYSKDSGEKIDHPMAKLVPGGSFLMRRI